MPSNMNGKHICDNCSKEFEWIYFSYARNKISSGIYFIEDIPSTSKLAYKMEVVDHKYNKIYINCPYCGFDNIFTVQIENM